MGKPFLKVPRNVLVVAFVAMASGFGQDLVSSVLPAFLVSLSFNRAAIGLIDGLLQGTTSLFRLISGVLSDKLKNRKGLIFFGYLLSSAARPFLALASSFGAIAGLRMADGAGKGMKDAPRDALVADSAGQSVRGRAFGFQRFVDTAGSVIGPLTASFILFRLGTSQASYRTVFSLAVIPGLVALGLIFFGIKEPIASRKPSLNAGKIPLPFWLFTAAMALAFLTKVNDALFLVRSIDQGIPPAMVPLLFAGFTLVYAILSYPIGIWSDRVGRGPLIAAGLFLLSAIEFGLSFKLPLAGSLCFFALYGLYYALTEGSARAIIADMVPSESRGLAYGVFHTCTGAALVAGGFGLGVIWDRFSPGTAFMFAAAGSLLAAAGVMSVLLIHKRNT